MSQGPAKKNPIGEIDLNGPAGNGQTPQAGGAYRGIRSPQLVDMHQRVESTQAGRGPAAPQNPADERNEQDHFKGVEEQYAIRFREPSRRNPYVPYLLGIVALAAVVIYVDTYERAWWDEVAADVRAYSLRMIEKTPALRGKAEGLKAWLRGDEGETAGPETGPAPRPDFPTKTKVAPRTLGGKAGAAGAGSAAANQALDRADVTHLPCDGVLGMVKKGLKLTTIPMRSVVGECHLVRNMPAEALRIAEEGLAVKNAALNGASTDLWLLKMRSLLAMGRVDEAQRMVGKGCTQFQRGAMCAGTMMVATYRRDLAKAEKLVAQYERLGLKGLRADVTLFVDAGRVAMLKGQYEEAERRLKAAQRFVPEDSPWLVRDMFEARMLNAYRKADAGLAERILKEASEHIYVDATLILPKLSLLRHLTGPDGTQKLREFLLEPRVYSRYLGDLDMFDVVTIESIRRGLVGLYLNYLPIAKKTAPSGPEARVYGERILLAEARAYVAQGQYNRAFKILKTVPPTSSEYVTALHLKGVALAGVAPSPQYFALAAGEFLKAYKAAPQWQSLWGLIAAFNQVDEKVNRGRMLAEMKRTYRGSPIDLWVAHLETDILMQDRQYQAAMAKVEAHLARFPNSPYALNQKLSLLKEAQRLKEWKELDASISQRNLLISNWQLPELRHYPLGPLALMP